MVEIKKRLGVRKDPTLRGLEAGMLGKNTVSMLAEDLAKKFRGEEVAPPTEVKKLVSSTHFDFVWELFVITIFLSPLVRITFVSL